MGPLASIVREPGQVRKEAAEANDLSAEMWLIRPPPFPAYEKMPSRSASPSPFLTKIVSLYFPEIMRYRSNPDYSLLTQAKDPIL